MKKILLALCAVTCLLQVSCDEKKTEEIDKSVFNDTLAVYYYNLRVHGKYEEYVKAMKSCDQTTPEYKKRMERMLHHYQIHIEKDKKGISHVKVLHSEMHDHNKMANVFLEVTYNDSSKEEILFPMVHDGKEWRIQ